MIERNLQIRHDGDDTDAVLGRGNVLRVGAVIESPQVCSILQWLYHMSSSRHLFRWLGLMCRLVVTISLEKGE